MQNFGSHYMGFFLVLHFSFNIIFYEIFLKTIAMYDYIRIYMASPLGVDSCLFSE